MGREGQGWKTTGAAPATGVTTTAPPDAHASSAGQRGGATLRDLYEKYGGGVYGRCYYVLKDKVKAEDAMQDVFARALSNLSGFRAEASPLTWLLTIATNHCLNMLRAEHAAWHQTFQTHELARMEREQQGSTASGPGLFENRDQVRRLLAGVDLETQAAAIHYYVDEMTLEEIATALGRSVPTIRKRLAAFSNQPAACAGAARGDQGGPS